MNQAGEEERPPHMKTWIWQCLLAILNEWLTSKSAIFHKRLEGDTSSSNSRSMKQEEGSRKTDTEEELEEDEERYPLVESRNLTQSGAEQNSYDFCQDHTRLLDIWPGN